MPSSPAYGNTTNVNGAQTAVGGASPPNQGPIESMYGRMNLGKMLEYMANPDTRAPAYQEYLDYAKSYGQTPALTHNGPNGTIQMRSALPTPTATSPSVPPASPALAYPGGDAPGIASYYRNSALQGYQGGQQQQSAMAGDIREATRNAQYMAAEPPATSSTGANQIMARQPADLQNAVTARAGNAYNGVVGAVADPNRLTPDQKAGLARESALRAAGGGPAADPTGLGARFGGAMGQQASSDYDAIQNGQAVRLADGSVARFTGTPESAKIAQNKGKIERESLRDRKNLNVPQEELDRRKRADAHKKERADRHQAFRDQNDGMNYRQYDRLQRTQQSIQRKVADGRLDQATADRMLEQETNKAMRRAEGRRSALVNADQSRPLPLAQAAEPQRVRQQPDAAAAVEQMATQSPIIKNLGITVESKPQDVMNSIASMNPQQMTSDQKFEAARHLHEYMLSQIESGNPAYALEDGISSDSKDPRLGFLGLQSLPPDNKDAMVRWFEDLHRQAKALGTPSTASPFGNAMPIRTGA